jgi:hypothetical protein
VKKTPKVTKAPAPAETRQLNVRIPTDVFKGLAHYVVDHKGASQASVTAEALRAFLPKRGA